MQKTLNPYQKSLQLKIVVRDPNEEDLRDAYEVCVLDKHRIPFEKALTLPLIATGIRNTAKAAIIRRGGR
jgi:hypothetical protein